MERKYYIYIWYREDDGAPFYVGKGKEERYKQLINRNRHFINVYKKHGGFPEKIIEGLTEQEAFEKEITIIKEYKKKYPLTNITNGGEGVSGLQHSKRTRDKISEKAKKQWEDPKFREKLIKSRRIGHSKPEVREKISKMNLGKKRTENQKENIKKAMKSPDVINKLAESHTKYRNIKCINGDDEVIIFENTREAVKWLETIGHKKPSMSSVIGCITGKNKTSYGYRWVVDKES
jgi:hypothetical protein